MNMVEDYTITNDKIGNNCKIYFPEVGQMKDKKQLAVKSLFVFSVIVPILLGSMSIIDLFTEYVILGTAGAVAAYLIIFRKYYFLSNLISSSEKEYTAFELKLGKFTGYACLAISAIFFIVAFLNK